MNRRDFTEYLTKYDTVIQAIARKLGGADDDLVADLRQEGMIALWRVDLTIVRKNRDAMVRNSIKYRMVDFLRKQQRHRSESLDSAIEAGMQLEFDEDVDRLRLLGGSTGGTWVNLNTQAGRNTTDGEDE